jgi:HD superfamily phosphohydrolase
MKRIFDPIHRFIELDDAETALLNTAPMQRLRRLRQLGLAYLAFPAAEHSRFSHVLGALAVGERIMESLRRHDSYFSDERDYAEQRRLLRVSLLLHDVGHGPFSHACEAVLGIPHEVRTQAILSLPEVRRALDALDVDLHEVVALITGRKSAATTHPTLPGMHGSIRSGLHARYPVLKEIVSGPNLDADRMDYLLRDAYFTGVVSGKYDVEQLIGSLRVFEHNGQPAMGVDGRGVVALESFVLARYMMFAAVYFHHTTRLFERILQDALREIWPHPQALNDIEAFLAWDDMRVLDAFRTAHGEEARALRDRHTLYGLAAEFNAEQDLSVYEACKAALHEQYGAHLWADEQEQLLHRLPLGNDETQPTLLVQTSNGVTDARRASDLIAKLSGKAYWRKLFVRKYGASLEDARRICRGIIDARR